MQCTQFTHMHTYLLIIRYSLLLIYGALFPWNTARSYFEVESSVGNSTPTTIQDLGLGACLLQHIFYVFKSHIRSFWILMKINWSKYSTEASDMAPLSRLFAPFNDRYIASSPSWVFQCPPLFLFFRQLIGLTSRNGIFQLQVSAHITEGVCRVSQGSS